MSAVIKSSEHIIRPINDLDLDAVMAIETEAYRFPWTKQIFHDCIRVGYCCRLVEYNNQVIAYAIMSMAAGEAHLLNFCVCKSKQGEGVGQFLLTTMIENAQNRSIDIIFLEVRPSNITAIGLYEKNNFNEVGRRKNYYPADNGREDAIIFALDVSF